MFFFFKTYLGGPKEKIWKKGFFQEWRWRNFSLTLSESTLKKDLETINLSSVWFGVGCNIGWVTSEQGCFSTPRLWVSEKRTDREMDSLLFTISTPRFENLTTALHVDRQSYPITESPHLPLIVWHYEVMSNKSGRWAKFLWSFQKIRTLGRPHGSFLGVLWLV